MILSAAIRLKESTTSVHHTLVKVAPGDCMLAESVDTSKFGTTKTSVEGHLEDEAALCFEIAMEA